MARILNINCNELWNRLKSWNHKAGRASARPVLLMWYVMRDKHTPHRDKWAIILSLAYLVSPIDILSARRLPVIGWIDELTSLALLIQKMTRYATPGMERRADAQLDSWFSESQTFPSAK